MLRTFILGVSLWAMMPVAGHATTVDQALECAQRVLDEARLESIGFVEAVEQYVSFKLTASMVMLSAWKYASESQRDAVAEIAEMVFTRMLADTGQKELDLDSIRFGRAYPDGRTNTVVVPVRYRDSYGQLQTAHVWVLKVAGRCYMADLEVLNVRWRFLIRLELNERR